jgi:hypothetical protein
MCRVSPIVAWFLTSDSDPISTLQAHYPTYFAKETSTRSLCLPIPHFDKLALRLFCFKSSTASTSACSRHGGLCHYARRQPSISAFLTLATLSSASSLRHLWTMTAAGTATTLGRVARILPNVATVHTSTATSIVVAVFDASTRHSSSLKNLEDGGATNAFFDGLFELASHPIP